MLDPQVVALLELAAKAGRPPMETLTAEEAREEYRRSSRALNMPAQEVASVDNRQIDGPRGPIGVRIYRALGTQATDALPCLIYFHGGGYTIGDLDTHDPVCRALANAARCAVVSVDYRRGPEHKFPAAVEDGVAAMRWVASNAATLNIDGERLAVGGDSAGGNLTAVTTLIARDAGGPKLALQILLYPSTHAPHNTPSAERNGDGYLLTRKVLDFFKRNYTNSPSDYDDWRMSPLLAPKVSNLPPALIITAGYDPLLDEGKAYADRLKTSGVSVTYHCYEGMIHGFITMGRVLSATQQAIEECAAALRQAFEK